MKSIKKIVSSFLCSITLTLSLSPLSTFASIKPYLDYYDARKTYTRTLEPKYQQISGPCWAFASIATLEGYLSKNGLLKESLSEKHLLNWANHRKTDGWRVNIHNGGNDIVSNGYLVSGDGIVLNKQCPYNCNNDCYECTSFIKPSFSVRGIKYLDPENKDEIKKAIVNYGAVYAGNNSHAFSIIGWNSLSSRWIVKDSGLGNYNCYSTVPFSNKLNALYCITDAKNYDDNEKIYQHDKFGANASFHHTKKLTVANVFDIPNGEKLNSVMVQSQSKDANIKIYYTETLPDGTPSNNKNSWQELYNGKIPYNGYYTYNLSKEVKVSNNKTSIIVVIESGESQSSIGAQYGTESLRAKTPPKASFEFDGYSFKELDWSLSIKAITKK